MTHTNNQSDPWWQLVLSEVSTVNSVVLYNRTDACCTARLTDVHVFISEQPFGDQTLAELLADNNVAHTYLAGDQSSQMEVPITGQGSYVRVQLAGSGTLSLAEVEIFGFGNSALGGQ